MPTKKKKQSIESRSWLCASKVSNRKRILALGDWVTDDVHAANRGRGSARRLEPEVAHMKLELEDDAEVQLDWNPKAEVRLDDGNDVKLEDDAESELAAYLATWEPLHALNDVAVMKKLSHGMAKFLRHIAHKLDLLDEDGWVDLEDALSHLQGCCELNSLHSQGLLCEACIVKAVRLSDRDSDREPRFELYISGSKTWIRATGGEIYRARSRS